MIIECIIELNWLRKHMKMVSSSQPVILILNWKTVFFLRVLLRRSGDVLDIFWTSYVRLICILYPEDYLPLVHPDYSTIYPDSSLGLAVWWRCCTTKRCSTVLVRVSEIPFPWQSWVNNSDSLRCWFRKSASVGCIGSYWKWNEVRRCCHLYSQETQRCY